MQTISVNKSSLRRGALFLIGIAGPALAGVVLHQSAAAVVAAVFGLLLSFSDQDGPLSGRYRILFLSAAGLIAGAVAGYLLRDYHVAFWIVFVAGAFAAGLANRYGRIPAMAARHACMALSVGFGVPVVQTMELLFCAGTLALVVIARGVDHLLFGHLPQLRQPARTEPPIRRCGCASRSLIRRPPRSACGSASRSIRNARPGCRRRCSSSCSRTRA